MSGLRPYFLYPGTIFVHSVPHLVTTVLGSCVAVCLWDQELRIGGMNHYQLPLWNGHGLASPKYGNVAIQKLLEKMIHLGCRKQGLIAKVFGGASVLQGCERGFNVGHLNIMVATDVLAREGLHIIGSDLGGNCGRKLKFNTETGEVVLRHLYRELN